MPFKQGLINIEIKNRCHWCIKDPVYQKYHDTEWGVPVHDDRRLFEFLILEGAQAGLSWLTILKRRKGYMDVFSDFDPEKVASYNDKDVKMLISNPSIIRNKLKIEAAIINAKAFLKIQDAYGSFDQYAWQFVNYEQKINYFEHSYQLPAISKESNIFSKDLKRRGFKFVGPIIIYAFMQATGMVNDHIISCFRHKEVIEENISTREDQDRSL